MADERRALRLAVIAFVLGAVLFAVTVGAAIYTRGQAESDLRSGLVEACEVNGNPLREAVQDLLRGEIKRSRGTSPSFFPDIPPAVFRQLVREEIEGDRAAIGAVAPVDCRAQYH